MGLTLRARILASFLVALVAFLAALAYGIAGVRGIDRELSRVQDFWLPLERQVTELRFILPELPADLLKQPPRIRKAFEGQYGVRLTLFRQQLKESQIRANAALHDPATDAAGAARLSKVVGALAIPGEETAGLLQDLLQSVETAGPEELETKRLKFTAADKRLREAIEGAVQAIDEGLRADAAAAEARSKRVLIALALLTAVATAFGLGATGLVGRVLSPVAELTAGVKRISEGDFSRRVAVRGGGEVAMLAGEFNQMVASLLSRDERLKALSAYNENVLESVRVGILVADARGSVTVLNRAAEEIWGIPRALAVGGPVSALEPVKPFLERIQKVAGGGAPMRLGATALKNDRMAEVSAVPFVQEGKQAGVVVLVEDVSERVRVERALLRSERLAAIGRMSSQITHEVRNPLNSLSLNVEMLEEEIGDRDEARKLLDAVAREIERLNQITEGYLSFARLPKPQLAREQVNTIVEALLRFVREEAEGAGVRVKAELAGNVPEVLADENQLRQALLNVVRNSLEAIREARKQRGSGGQLVVTTRRDDGYVEVTLADDGPGIASKDLGRIFDPFYSTKPEGTGLGLPLTQQIIEEHGGSIACESEPGRGTTFTIRLPVA